MYNSLDFKFQFFFCITFLDMEGEQPSLAYQIFEKTGEKLYEVYDYVVRNPALVKISRNKMVSKI